MIIYSFQNDDFKREESLIEALDIDLSQDNVITVVGGGGKTHTLFRLGEEISSLNKKVAITTTTNMYYDKDFFDVQNQDDFDNVKEALKNQNLIKLGKAGSKSKISYLGDDLIRELISTVDFTLIEGDGSKMLPLKAPREDEPIIVDETKVIVGVMGIDALNQKINKTCHRAHLVAKLLKKDLEDFIEHKDFFTIATSKNGLKKKVNCKYRVVINKIDYDKELIECRKIVDYFKGTDIHIVFTSYMDDK